MCMRDYLSPLLKTVVVLREVGPFLKSYHILVHLAIAFAEQYCNRAWQATAIGLLLVQSKQLTIVTACHLPPPTKFSMVHTPRHKYQMKTYFGGAIKSCGLSFSNLQITWIVHGTVNIYDHNTHVMSSFSQT